MKSRILKLEQGMLRVGNQSKSWRVCLGFMLILATGCEWSLRGNLPMDAGLDSVYLDNQLPPNQRGPDSIAEDVLARLTQTGVSVLDSKSDAQLGLTILLEETETSVLSLTSDLFEQQVRLRKTIYYNVTRGDETLAVNNSASTYRDIAEDQSNAAAKNRESALIYTEINRDLADLILRDLQRYTRLADENPS